MGKNVLGECECVAMSKIVKIPIFECTTSRLYRINTILFNGE